MIEKSKQARRASFLGSHKYDFRPKLHHTEFSYHFITSSLKYRIFQLVCENIILIQYCFLFGFGKDAIKSKKGAIRDLIVVPRRGKQFNLQGSPAISK